MVTHDRKNHLCIDAVAEVVRMIPSVAGEIVRMLPLEQVGPQPGYVGERHAVASHLGEDVGYCAKRACTTQPHSGVGSIGDTRMNSA